MTVEREEEDDDEDECCCAGCSLGEEEVEGEVEISRNTNSTANLEEKLAC